MLLRPAGGMLLALFVVAPGASAGLAAPRGHATAAVHASGRARCPRWPVGSGILKDGDFHGATDEHAFFMQGQQPGAHWSVTMGSVDLDTVVDAPSGACSFDLDGYSPGALMHSAFATIPDTHYTVTFEFSANGQCGTAPLKTMLVEAAGQSQHFMWNVTSQGDAQNGNYGQESWTFTATHRRTSLTFESLDSPSSTCGPIIAAVAVSAA